MFRNVQAVNNANSLNCMKHITVKIVDFLLINKNIGLIKKYVNGIVTFPKDYHRRIINYEKKFFSRIKVKYKTVKDMINKLRSSNGKTKLEFQQKRGVYFHEMNYMRQSNTFTFEEDHFAKNGESRGMIRHERLLIMKFLQTKSLIKNKI